jgi:hypothetical protein
MDNYSKITQDNLAKLYALSPEDLESNLPCIRENESFIFDAFGERCRISPNRICCGEKTDAGVLGILISLYALQNQAAQCILEPFKAYRELPNSMPYAAAFAVQTENRLVPHVDKIEKNLPTIIRHLSGRAGTGAYGGDFSFLVYPLPKIALYYIFYRADDEFPATVTCLFSSNALSFLPIDALADTAEYTSKKILQLLD